MLICTHRTEHGWLSADQVLMDKPVLVSITQAKVRLEELIEGARGGEKIIICRRGNPVAWLKPIYARKPVQKASRDNEASSER